MISPLTSFLVSATLTVAVCTSGAGEQNLPVESHDDGAGVAARTHATSWRGVERVTPPAGSLKQGGERFDQDVIVFTANQGFLSRIYLLGMDGSVLAFHEFTNYRFVDLEVVNNEVYAAEAFAPRVLKVDLETWDLDVIVDDWSLYYFYDLAFDGTYFYLTEWDLNRYEFDGTKNGMVASDEDTSGGAWDGSYYWTLNYVENVIKCWDVSGWPSMVEVSTNNFAPPTPACRGLWFDGTYFWTAESIEDTLGRIYQFDYDGRIVNQWLAPAFQGWGACVIRGDRPIPAVSTVGLAAMVLLLLGVGAVVIKRSRTAPSA
jgi:hypothetical protein